MEEIEPLSKMRGFFCPISILPNGSPSKNHCHRLLFCTFPVCSDKIKKILFDYMGLQKKRREARKLHKSRNLCQGLSFPWHNLLRFIQSLYQRCLNLFPGLRTRRHCLAMLSSSFVLGSLVLKNRRIRIAKPIGTYGGPDTAYSC